MLVKLVGFPHSPSRERSKGIFAVRESTNVWFKVCENVASRNVSKQSSCCDKGGVLSYFQSILFLIRLNVWPQISQLKGIPLETALGVGGTFKPPPSSPAWLETNDVCDTKVGA